MAFLVQEKRLNIFLRSPALVYSKPLALSLKYSVKIAVKMTRYCDVKKDDEQCASSNTRIDCKSKLSSLPALAQVAFLCAMLW